MATVAEARGELHNVTIVLESAAHFHARDGSDVQVHPGAYHVSLGPDGDLTLGAMQKPERHGTVLRAFGIWHPFRLTAPLALSIAAEHDRLHLVLLLPGGGALQSTGSLQPAARLADTPPFVTPHDLAQAIITRFPGPLPKYHHPFNAATVIAVPGIRPWGTIDPGSQPTSFAPGSEPPNWIGATVTACAATPGIACPGLGTSVPRNPPTSEPQLVSTTSVSIKPVFSWVGQTVELLVTAQVVNTGGKMRYMTWTDMYQQVPVANGPFTFPGVIVATGTPPPNPPPPGQRTWAEETASDFTSPSGRGPQIEFELRVNGITGAVRICEYLTHYPGGAPELRCS